MFKQTKLHTKHSSMQYLIWQNSCPLTEKVLSNFSFLPLKHQKPTNFISGYVSPFRLSFSPSKVSSLFKDGTIGTDINIVVVSLLLLEQDPVSWFIPSFRGEVSRLYRWLMGIDSTESLSLVIAASLLSPPAGFDHKSSRWSVPQQFLSVAVGSGGKERQTARPCCPSHWPGHLLLEEWALWHSG